MFARLAFQTEAMEGVALAGFVRSRFAPRIPARLRPGHVDERNAIDGAHWNAKLAAGAQRIDDGVHGLGPAYDAVNRAGLEGQGQTHSRGLVDDGEAAGAFDAVGRVQGKSRSTGDGCKAHDPFAAA